MSQERFQRFLTIRAAYQARDAARLRNGQLSLRTTQYGFWGTTNMNDAYELFRRIKLEERKGFLDLGCGDGRIVAIASLFTEAHGIEGDAALVSEGRTIFRELGLDPELVLHGNYEASTFTGVDVLFMFPDKAFTDTFVRRLEQHFRGVLYLYTNIYPLQRPKGRTIWIERLPVLTYSFSEAPEDFREAHE